MIMENNFISEKIKRLKTKKNAVVLAHNYMPSDVQDAADYVGDSLGLSIEASRTSASIIVFCGVHFMAQTAKILNPAKKVLMPDAKAGCPMANMINAKQLGELKLKNRNAKVVCYINSTAQVKALSDICCTSGNAVEIVKSLGNDEIIFVPDQYLGSYVEEKLGRKMILWNGYCNIHTKILPHFVQEAKKKYPKAIVMAHPECTPDVRRLSDFVGSTSKMLSFPSSSRSEEFIVATETGIIHQLKKNFPDKEFFPAYDRAICPNMKLTTLEKLLWCLEDEAEEIFVEEPIASKAKVCIDKMIAVSS